MSNRDDFLHFRRLSKKDPNNLSFWPTVDLRKKKKKKKKKKHSSANFTLLHILHPNQSVLHLMSKRDTFPHFKRLPPSPPSFVHRVPCKKLHLSSHFRNLHPRQCILTFIILMSNSDDFLHFRRLSKIF